jgi:succinyl-CoA synthetase beta subunit
MVKKLYNIFMENKLELLEINPLAITEENKLVALDCKVTDDDNYIIPISRGSS